VPTASQPDEPQLQSVPLPLFVQAKHSGARTVKWAGSGGFVVSTVVLAVKQEPPDSAFVGHSGNVRDASASEVLQDQPVPVAEHCPSNLAPALAPHPAIETASTATSENGFR